MLQDSLKNIMQAGDSIYTQAYYNDEWIPNIIEDIDDNIIKINLTDYFFRKGVMEGDSISIRYSHSSDEYVLEGEITNIDIYNTYTISVFINNVSVYQERRKHFRYYAKLGSSLKNDLSKKGTYSIVTNISLSGLALISKANINIEQSVYIDLFESSKEIISVNGTIVRKRSLNYGYEYGIAFDNIEEENQEKLKHLINKLEKKLQKEYFKMK